MKLQFNSLKIKVLIFTVLTIIFWQYSFPQQVVAQTRLMEIEYPEIQSRFTKQWEINVFDSMNRLPINKNRPQPETISTMVIPVTAYSSTPDQTSGNPFITASGAHVRDGIIAANFLKIGTRVRFPEHFGNKIFVVEDRMAARYWHKADIWMETREEAKQWGIRHVTIEIL